MYLTAKDFAIIAAAIVGNVNCTARAKAVADVLEAASMANVKKIIAMYGGLEDEEVVVQCDAILAEVGNEDNDFDRTTPTLIAGLNKINFLLPRMDAVPHTLTELARLATEIGLELGRRDS